MELRTAGNRIRIGPFRVDYRGPHRAITSDGLPVPHLPQNRPVPAGTLVSVGVESASPEGIGPERPLGPAGGLRPSNKPTPSTRSSLGRKPQRLPHPDLSLSLTGFAEVTSIALTRCCRSSPSAIPEPLPLVPRTEPLRTAESVDLLTVFSLSLPGAATVLGIQVGDPAPLP